ncbi:MAG: hypothetical protein KDC54_04015 [Lewinella sp.]|nr:hypothetical protein [Lewinella sp.]
MKNTLLVLLIAQLSEPERRQALDWLQSPVHNRRPDLVMLYTFLAERVLDLQLTPSREACYHHLYPDQPFDDQQLRLLCSYLLKCLEEWLAWRQWQQDSGEPSLALLRAYREKGLEKHFRHQARRVTAGWQTTEHRHADHFLHRFRLEQEVYSWASRSGRDQPLNLQAQEDALQTAFMGYKLRQACLAVAHQQVFPANYQLYMLPELLHWAEQAPFRDEPAIQLYRHIYAMYRDDRQETAFRAYQRALFEHATSFPSEEGRDLLLFGINYCIRRINQGQQAFQREAFALYQKGLDDNLLLKEGRLSPFTYNNIIGIALRLNELEWAEHFLHAFRSKLEARQREPIFALNAGRIAYHRQDFRAALQHLHRADNKDFIHHMTAKTLQLKIYFESGDHQLLASHIKNVRAYLRRRRQPGYHEQVFGNIFMLTEQLLKLPPYADAQRAALRQRIEQTQPLTEKAWLLAQL